MSLGFINLQAYGRGGDYDKENKDSGKMSKLKYNELLNMGFVCITFY